MIAVPLSMHEESCGEKTKFYEACDLELSTGKVVEVEAEQRILFYPHEEPKTDDLNYKLLKAYQYKDGKGWIDCELTDEEQEELNGIIECKLAAD